MFLKSIIVSLILSVITSSHIRDTTPCVSCLILVKKYYHRDNAFKICREMGHELAVLNSSNYEAANQLLLAHLGESAVAWIAGWNLIDETHPIVFTSHTEGGGSVNNIFECGEPLPFFCEVQKED
eukprot:GHVP01061640.1.p1 GENE.GHVP01061640.1~~GHVP01061640.1.p1  ORF type:complete len:125 (+),score=17.00 GHVP01061640.1:3-377(+)